MRYHWGLGIGHLHAHSATNQAPSSRNVSEVLNPMDNSEDIANSVDSEKPLAESPGRLEGNRCNAVRIDEEYESDASEMALGDRELEGWEDAESDGSQNDPEEDIDDLDSEGGDDEDIYE
jgi:hypothetical protein